MVAALAGEEDESPTALALKGAISSTVAIRLATTFTTETGGAVPPPARAVNLFGIQALISLI